LLRRLSESVLERRLSEEVRRLMAGEESRRATVAIEATGLTPEALSTCFVKRAKDREPGFTWRYRRKWTMTIDLD
jgi:hypothetical protein